MSSNQLNDISKVYLNQIAEETPAERIDRISKANVAKQKKDSDAKKAARDKKTAEFQKHKASVMAKGGRPVDALDSWHKKQAHKESYSSVSEKKEVNVKDTYKTVAAVIDYDRSKKGSKDADYDSMKGDKKAAKKERDYAAFERGKMKKDDPNWKHKKGSTSEEVESLKRLIESGKFSNEEIESMAWDIYEGEGHGVSLRGLRNDRERLKHSEIGSSREKELKTRIKDKETQMQQVQSQRWNPKTKKLEKNLGSRPHVSPEAQRNENYQAMRNPEKEEKKDTRSAREKRMADPKKGINSPAFKEFMRQQGM